MYQILDALGNSVGSWKKAKRTRALRSGGFKGFKDQHTFWEESAAIYCIVTILIYA